MKHEKESLKTIQKREKLNVIFRADDKGPGDAHHCYVIKSAKEDVDNIISTIQFQYGPRHDGNSVSGVLDVDLLEICRDRLQCFQDGPFASIYNEQALHYIEKALHCLNERVEDRIRRNTLGKYEK